MPPIAKLTALLAALVLTGCGTVYFPTEEDQQASFSAYKSQRIGGEALNSYILRRTVPLLPSEGTSAMLNEVESRGAGQWDPVSGSALATAIAPDGYFLTADHVVENHPPFLAESDAHGLIINRGRTVKRFPHLDLAIIKFEDVRNPHFGFRSAPPAKGDVLFSGGPSGLVVDDFGPRKFFAAGSVSRSRTFTSRGVPGWRVSVEIPNRPGSSGGPVLDGDGNLCGIVVAGKYGRFAKRKTPLTYATMIDHAFLQNIVREDRAKRRRTDT